MERTDQPPDEFEGYTELNIFDFDGTLFRSPCPSPKIWDKQALGKIKAMPGPKQNGFGWFQDPVTLSPPCVPDPPPADLWIDTVVEKVEKSMSNILLEPPSSEDDTETQKSRCITALLTGRSSLYDEIIKRMVNHRGLKFDRFGLKPVGTDQSTMDFKQDFIRGLIRDFKPKFVNIFEDREEHVKKFTSFFANTLSPHGIRWKVHDVSHLDGDSFLSRSQETEVIRALVEKYGKGEWEIENSVSYTAVVLDNASKQKLLKRFHAPEGWRPYAHHMTVCLGALHAAIKANAPGMNIMSVDMLGQETDLIVEAVGQSDRALAVQVKCPKFGCVNKIPHITIAVAPDAKPVESNWIKEWRALPEKDRMHLHGTLEEVGGWLTVKQKPRSTQKKGGNPAGIQIGPLVKKHLPELKGKQIKEAIDDVTEWMNQMHISTEEKVEEYLLAKKSK